MKLFFPFLLVFAISAHLWASEQRGPHENPLVGVWRLKEYVCASGMPTSISYPNAEFQLEFIASGEIELRGTEPNCFVTLTGTYEQKRHNMLLKWTHGRSCSQPDGFPIWMTESFYVGFLDDHDLELIAPAVPGTCPALDYGIFKYIR